MKNNCHRSFIYTHLLLFEIQTKPNETTIQFIHHRIFHKTVSLGFFNPHSLSGPDFTFPFFNGDI